MVDTLPEKQDISFVHTVGGQTRIDNWLTNKDMQLDETIGGYFFISGLDGVSA